MQKRILISTWLQLYSKRFFYAIYTPLGYKNTSIYTPSGPETPYEFMYNPGSYKRQFIVEFGNTENDLLRMSQI